LPQALLKPKKEPAELISWQQVQQNSRAIGMLLEKEKVYRNPTLTITELAKHLQLPTNVASYSISKAFDKSFRDLVNEYRVEEVKRKLADPAFSHLSILGIALDSGFNSEASFYRVFKKHTHVSPKEYRILDR
jgi:AraC-like DNA-binding protein